MTHSKGNLRSPTLRDRSVLIGDSYPPAVVNEVPICAFSIRRKDLSRPAKVVIFGPVIVRRRLNVDRESVKSWIRENFEHLARIRLKSDKASRPKLLVVLEEFVCTSWTHLSWDKYQGTELTNMALAQGSPESAPRWRLLGLQDSNVSISGMISNTNVSF